jgi:ABC-2 type transport system permease protein
MIGAGMNTDAGIAARRLSLLHAAYVVARRDFVAILFRRTFIFFLLGPLFPVVVGMLAASVGQKVDGSAAMPEIGVAMAAPDANAMIHARDRLAGKLGPAMPAMVSLKRLAPGETYNAAAVLKRGQGNLAAVLTGTVAHPVLTATAERIEWWQGAVAMVAAEAAKATPSTYPEIRTVKVKASAATDTRGRLRTAQAAQTLLFLLIMMLAGMVLSNLVEEKGNKIIEVLAAAVPMDAVFLGKLFAMLGISMVGIAVWGSAAGMVVAFGGPALPDLPTPGVGWPMFIGLGVVYFSMGYLLLGSVFLAIGSLASSVREVQTLSMPVTMGQVLVFFLASLSVSSPGTPVEWGAIAFPFSSPFVMLARAAQSPLLWPHALALCWQVTCVALSIRFGAALFRKRVMQSGPQGAKKPRRLAFGRKRAFTTGSDTAA